jgi:DNA ligase (NAD+)
LFHSKESLLEFPYNEEDLVKLEDIWPEIALNVCEYFNNQAHKRILSELAEILNIYYYEKLEIIADWNESIYFWKKMCITWSFISDEWKKVSRDDLVIQLESVWWDFVWSVSKNTDFLLAWEKAGSKLKKATELWVEVINLEEFYKEINK